MKKVTYRDQIPKVLAFSLVVFLLSSFSLISQDVVADSSGDIEKGKALFNQNCAACHSLTRKMTGPALDNVEARLAEDEGLDREWLYKWIKNSSGLIKSGDAYAVKVYNEYNQAAMTAFPTLSNEDIDNMLAYTAAAPAAPVVEAVVAGGDVSSESSGISNEMILGALSVVFALLVFMLIAVNNTLRKVMLANGVDVDKEIPKGLPIWKAFAKNQFLVLVTAMFLILAGAFFAYGWMMQIGVDQGYEPIQPIHYSHRIHAGDNKIDCKYCHSSARKSKTSGIPSLNVCMNCHKSIYQVADATLAEGVQFGIDYNEEIQKLYTAVGWDEENQEYNGTSQPVAWVRVHNLPDFAYFNHSQHVEVGQVECQTCHGPVEEMEVMSQFAPLTMGWCLNCHRESSVKTEGNEYYAKIHEELSKKYGVTKLSPAQMGGLECGKCHY